MQKKRRTFIRTAGLMTAGSIVLPHWACGDGSNKTTSKPTEEPAMIQPSLSQFGIQLYTLRDVIYDDPKATLKELASYGFKQLESYEADNGLGIFWGMGHKDFKKYLDDIGMTVVSSHTDIYNNFEEKAAHAAEIGMSHLICPHVGPQKSKEEWKKITDKFNACGEICKKNGIRFAYHNHAYSFRAFTGMIPHDFLMDNTDPELVDYEMDIYWVVTGGADPVEYLKKYKNRFRLCHIKDRTKGAAPDNEEASCTLGTGTIDFPSILKVAKDNGMDYFIMEQEKYEGTTPMESAKAGAAYLKELRFA